MSTNSNIGILNKDKSVRVVYAHWDGYPQYVGKILFENYNSEEKVNKLLDLGDISSLGSTPESDPELWDYKKGKEDDGTKCVTYKDRGETGVDAVTYSNPKEWLRALHDGDCGWIEYAYLYANNNWYYASSNQGYDEFRPLTKAIVEHGENAEEYKEIPLF